jgi:hypothetical protein
MTSSPPLFIANLTEDVKKYFNTELENYMKKYSESLGQTISKSDYTKDFGHYDKDTKAWPDAKISDVFRNRMNELGKWPIMYIRETQQLGLSNTFYIIDNHGFLILDRKDLDQRTYGHNVLKSEFPLPDCLITFLKNIFRTIRFPPGHSASTEMESILKEVRQLGKVFYEKFTYYQSIYKEENINDIKELVENNKKLKLINVKLEETIEKLEIKLDEQDKNLLQAIKNNEELDLAKKEIKEKFTTTLTENAILQGYINEYNTKFKTYQTNYDSLNKQKLDLEKELNSMSKVYQMNVDRINKQKIDLEKEVDRFKMTINKLEQEKLELKLNIDKLKIDEIKNNEKIALLTLETEKLKEELIKKGQTAIVNQTPIVNSDTLNDIGEEEDPIHIENFKPTFKSVIEEEYEITNDAKDFISCDELIEYCNSKKLGLSETKIGKELSKLTSFKQSERKTINGRTKRVRLGIRKQQTSINN